MAADKTEVRRVCIVCDKENITTVDTVKFLRWRGGELVQNVWPEMTADERESLITGTHPACWSRLFGEEE